MSSGTVYPANISEASVTNWLDVPGTHSMPLLQRLRFMDVANKWHRAFIGAAGMYVEVILASFATFLWWFSQPGLLNQISLAVIFICSVSTNSL